MMGNSEWAWEFVANLEDAFNQMRHKPVELFVERDGDVVTLEAVDRRLVKQLRDLQNYKRADTLETDVRAIAGRIEECANGASIRNRGHDVKAVEKDDHILLTMKVKYADVEIAKQIEAAALRRLRRRTLHQVLYHKVRTMLSKARA